MHATISRKMEYPYHLMINLPASEILSIESNGVTLQEISGQRHTMEGYSKQIGEYLHLSIIDGNLVNITVESEEYDVMGIFSFGITTLQR